jgi:hypothetical protein
MPATLADIQKIYGDEVYPPYKGVEPFMENSNGIGYQGVVLYNRVEDKNQCNECGEWFERLGSHVYSSHSMLARDYKDKYGLLRKTALCTLAHSRKMADILNKTKKNNPNLGKRGIDLLKRQTRLERIKNAKTGNFGTKLQYKNSYGYCPAQIAQQLIIIRDELGKESLQDVKMEDIFRLNSNLYQFLTRKYKSVEKAAIALGLSKLSSRYYSDSELIAKLRNFVREEKRLPKLKEFKSDAFRDHFGSWRRALSVAGLDQLLAEVKGV